MEVKLGNVPDPNQARTYIHGQPQGGERESSNWRNSVRTWYATREANTNSSFAVDNDGTERGRSTCSHGSSSCLADKDGASCGPGNRGTWLLVGGNGDTTNSALIFEFTWIAKLSISIIHCPIERSSFLAHTSLSFILSSLSLYLSLLWSWRETVTFYLLNFRYQINYRGAWV